jgi:hypothetical protein
MSTFRTDKPINEPNQSLIYLHSPNNPHTKTGRANKVGELVEGPKTWCAMAVMRTDQDLVLA